MIKTLNRRYDLLSKERKETEFVRHFGYNRSQLRNDNSVVETLFLYSAHVIAQHLSVLLCLRSIKFDRLWNLISIYLYIYKEKAEIFRL